MFSHRYRSAGCLDCCGTRGPQRRSRVLALQLFQARNSNEKELVGKPGRANGSLGGVRGTQQKGICLKYENGAQKGLTPMENGGRVTSVAGDLLPLHLKLDLDRKT
jgi:hypothetical protein